MNTLAGLDGFGRDWLSRSALWPLPQRLAVGWSGGADSTALLLALRQTGHEVQAWHVDHGWRPESAAEARLLARRARAWGIEFRSARLADVPASNLEARARELRYAQFERWHDATGIDCLCLGHQRDDQAETVCMRLLQGASVAGCRGMAGERRHGRLRILRPLLHVSASDLRRALQQAGIPWLEDRSNHDVRFMRNRIRSRLFPAMRQAGVNPSDLFLRLQAVAMQLHRELDTRTRHLLACNPEGKSSLRLPWSDWVQASPAERAFVLQAMTRALLGEGRTPGRRHIELVEVWTGKSGTGGLDLSGFRLQRRSHYLHLLPTAAGLQDAAERA